MYSISSSVIIRAPRERVYALVADMEKRLRLHPAWEILSFKEIGDRRYGVRVRKESGEEKEYVFLAETSKDRVAYKAEDGELEVTLSIEESQDGVKLTQEEKFTLPWKPSKKTLKSMSDELGFWLESLKHYCELRRNPIARTSKFIIDRLLLRLPPNQRRIVLLIIILNAGILVLFTIMFAGMKVVSWIM